MRKGYVLLSLSIFFAYLASWKYDGTVIYDLSISSIILLLTLTYLLKRNIDDGLSFPRAFFPVLSVTWIIWLGISLLWSDDPYTSWFSFWEISALPMTAFIYILIPDNAKDLLWRYMSVLILISTWGLIFMALYQELQWMREGVAMVNLRPYGPLMDTNSFAAWMDLLFFPISAYFIYHDVRRNTTFTSTKVDPVSLMYMVTMGLITVVYFTTDSRGWELSWICTFPLFVWGVYKVTRTWRYSAMIFGLVSISGVLVGYVHRYNMFFHMSPNYIGTHASTVSRMLMWVSAWHMYLSRPWLGTGLGTYFLVYPRYRSILESASAGTYAHNDYLQFLVEGGPINLAMLMLFVFFVLYTLYLLLISGKCDNLSTGTRLSAIGLALGLYAVCGHALGNFIFYNMPIALLSGLFAGRLWWITSSAPQEKEILRRIGIHHNYIVVFALYVATFISVADLALDGYSYLIFQTNIISGYMSTGSFQRLRYESAVILSYIRPLDVTAHTELGNMYLDEFNSVHNAKRKKELIRDVVRQFRMEDMPQKVNIYYVLGNIYMKDYTYLNLNKNEGERRALHYYSKALYYKPYYVDDRYAESKDIYEIDHESQVGAMNAVNLMKDGVNNAIFRQNKAKDAWLAGLEMWGLEHNYHAALKWDISHLRTETWYTPWTRLVRYMHGISP